VINKKFLSERKSSMTNVQIFACNVKTFRIKNRQMLLLDKIF